MGKKKTTLMDQSQQEELNYKDSNDNKYSSAFDMPDEFDLISQESKKTESSEENSEDKKNSKKSTKKFNKKVRSKKFLNLKKMVDSQKLYPIDQAIKLVIEINKEKFDPSKELNLVMKKDKLSGEVKLPHGTGKEKAVEVFSQKTIKKIESKKIDFDVLIAKPQDMGKIAKFARILGPKGLMPNPKNGTISQDPEKAAKDLKGKMIFKTEKKAPLIHLTIGKRSFGDKKLKENLIACLKAVNYKLAKKASICTSMSPGINLDLNSIE